jgi:hypothetical protein
MVDEFILEVGMILEWLKRLGDICDDRAFEMK